MMFYDIHTHKFVQDPNVFSIISSENVEFNLPCSVGIHPWNIDTKYMEKLRLLDIFIRKTHVFAVGEIGLDKVCKIDFKLQKEVLIKQLTIAEKYLKPVIIHCVRAYDEILMLTKNFNLPVIMHGFNKGHALAEKFISRGYFLSFGKSIFDRKSKSIDSFESAPLDQIFLETDESEFTIKEIYLRAAEIKNITKETLKEKVEGNFRRVFSGSRC